MKILIPDNNKGAILIITIIIGVVALAAGLTAANFVSRSTRNITDQESSIKALTVAENGIEKVLGAADISTYLTCPVTNATDEDESYIPTSGQTGVSTNCVFKEDSDGDSINDQSYYLEVRSKGGKTTYDMDSVDKDSVLEISTEGMTGNLDLSWNSDGSAFASILLTEVYLDGTEYKVKKYAYNPTTTNTTNGQSTNGFTQLTNSKATFTLTAGTKILRIKPLYFNAKQVKLAGTSTFPEGKQGFDIFSTGCTCENVLDTNSRKNASIRKVKVSKSREHLPAIFDFVLYSGSETEPLTK